MLRCPNCDDYGIRKINKWGLSALFSFKCDKCNAKISTPYVSLIYRTVEVCLVPLFAKSALGANISVLLAVLILFFITSIDYRFTPLVVRCKSNEDRSVLWYNVHFLVSIIFILGTMFLAAKIVYLDFQIFA